MANPQHAGPFLKEPRLVDKTAKRRAADARWRKVCRAVDARDNGQCIACFCRTVVTLAAISSRREHHHIIPRSRGGTDTTANVCTLCLSCHTSVHVTRRLELKGNADGTLKAYFTPELRSPR